MRPITYLVIGIAGIITVGIGVSLDTLNAALFSIYGGVCIGMLFGAMIGCKEN